MKRIRDLLVLMLAAVMVLSFTVPALADYFMPRLYDGAGVLSSSEAAEISDRLDKISEKYNFDIIICTLDGLPEGYRTIEEFATDYIKQNNFGYGEGTSDKCLLTLDMNERDWCISVCGFGDKAFTAWGRDYIGKQMKEAGLSKNKYKQAFDEFITQCDEFIKQTKDGKPFDKNNVPKEYRKTILKKAIVIGVISGIILALLVVLVMYGSMKSVARKAEAAHYVVDNSLDISYANDVFLYSKVTKTAKASSSGGSRSSSSGGVSHTSGKF